MVINKLWEQRIKENGVDFVDFVDITTLPAELTEGYPCAVLFGKALSKEYLSTLRAGLEPESKEFFSLLKEMDALGEKLADWLATEGYKSSAKLKTQDLPHKTVALRTGMGFIGKNNLLVTDRYGCALLLGKVLTTAPFMTRSEPLKEPQCGDCHICVDVCQNKALHGKTWSITTPVDEMINPKLCNLCLKCMVWCPHTAEYIDGKVLAGQQA